MKSNENICIYTVFDGLGHQNSTNFHSKIIKTHACNPNMLFDTSIHRKYQKVTQKCPQWGTQNPRKISETLPTSKYTAYSENKGEKLAFCTTTTKEGSKLIDENTLTFVAVHELGHVMTESVGHTKEFWQNFKFLLKNAVKIGIYKPVDYKKKPKNYCGMKITDNPYYDL